MSITLTRPAVEIARQPSARARLALTLAVLALPGVSIAWALPAGGPWIGVPLAVTALTVGIRARQAQSDSTGYATAAAAAPFSVPRFVIWRMIVPRMMLLLVLEGLLGWWVATVGAGPGLC